MQVEQLEARRVLASWNWTGAGVDTNWTTAANWALASGTDADGVPNANDDLAFPTGPTQLTANNDFAAGTTFSTIAITGNNYVLTGNDVVLTSSVTVGAAGATTLSLAIGSDGDGITFTKNAAGALTINGNNTYAGVTTINQGTVTITSDNALGASGVGNETIVNGSNTTTGTIVALNPAAAITVAESWTFAPNAAGRVTFNNTAQANVLNGPITINATSATTFAQISSNGSGSLVINGDITGSIPSGNALVIRGGSTNAANALRGSINLTGGNFTKTDAGLWAIGAAGKTYSWPMLQVSVGTVRLDVANVLPSASTVTIGQGDGNAATLNLNGFSQTIAGLSLNNANPPAGLKQITSAAAATLTVNSAANSTFGGVIAGAIALTKAGTGTLTLSGNNTYTGQTTISAGVLQAISNNALGAASGITRIIGNVGGSGRLELLGNVTIAEPITLEARQAASADADHIRNVSGHNALTGAITGTTGGSEYNITAEAGVLEVAGNLTNPNTGTRNLKIRGAAEGIISGDISGGWFLIKQATGRWILTGTNSYTGTTTISDGTLLVGAPLTTAVTIPNNGFETPALAANAFQYNPVGGSWTFTGGSGIARNGSGFNNAAATEGAQVGLVQNLNSITQSITVPTTGLYVLSFLSAARNNANGGNTLNVNIDGAPVITAYTPLAKTSYEGVTTAILNLTAGSHDIQFVGTTPTPDRTSFVDNVRLTPVAGFGTNTNAIPDTSSVTIAATGRLSLADTNETIGPLAGVAGAEVTLGTGTLTINSTANATFDGIISGTGGLTVTGTTIQTLGGTAANTYLGTTTVNGGVLAFNKTPGVDAIGPGGLVVRSVAAATAEARLLASSQLPDTGTVIVDANFSGGAAILNLNGFNDMVGTTTVRSITGSAGQINTGAGTLILNGDLNFQNERNATGNTGAEVIITGNLDLNGPRNISVTSGNTQTNSDGTINAVISNGQIIKQGSRRLLLGGSAANTYAGGTLINAGAVVANKNGALGTGMTTVTAVAGTQLVLGNGVNISSPLTIAGGSVAGQGALHVPTGAATYSGPITITGSTAAGGHFGGGTLTIANSITSSVDVVFRIGTVILAGAGSNFASATLGQGILRLGINNALPTTSNLVLGSSGAGIFDLNGFSQTLNILTKSASAGTVDNTAAGTTSTLTLGSNNATSTFAGVIQDSGAGSVVNVAKIGTGTLTLSGVNSYVGTTTVSGGVLSTASIQNNGTDSGLGAGTSIVLGGGVLQYTGASTTTNRNFTINAGINKLDVTTAATNLTLTGLLTGTGRLTKVGPGTLTLDNAGTSTLGGLDAAGGNLVLAGNSVVVLTSTARIGVSPGSLDAAAVTIGTQPGSGTLTIQDNASLTAAALMMGENNSAGPGADLTNMVATVNQTGGTVITSGNSGEVAGIRVGHWPGETSTYNLSGGALSIQGGNDLAIATDGIGTFHMTGGTASSAGVAVNHRNAGGNATYRVTGGVYTVGARGVFSAGDPATFELGGSGGTLRAAANMTVAVPAKLVGTGANAATMDTNGFTITASSTLADAGLGASDLTKIGNGKLILANAGNTFTGDFDIVGGQVEATIGHNDTNPTSALGNPSVARDILVGPGATLQFSANDVFGNALTTPQATIAVTGGIVTNTGNFFNSLGPIVLDGATLTAVGGANASYQAWRLTGDLTAQGTTPSSITASGANSGIHLAAPTLINVNDVSGNANPDLTISATLIDQTPSQASAPGSFTKTGAGTLVLATAASTFTGNLSINQGIVRATVGHNDTNANSALGNPNAFRNINVGSGATLEFSANDVLGNAAANPLVTLNVNGGTVTNTGNFFNTLGPTTLNAGTLTSIGGAAPTFQAYRLSGTVSVVGSAPSLISATGTSSGVHLGANTTFDVADVTGNGAADLIVTAVLVDQTGSQGNAAAGLTKIGAGTLAMNSASVYTGATNINAGALGGTGSLVSDVNIASSAALSPGGTPGLLTVGDTTLAANSTFVAELTATGNDRLDVNGNLVIQSGALLSATNSGIPTAGQPYILIAPTGTITGTFAGLPENAFVDINGLKYHITYGDPNNEYDTGNTVALIRNNPVIAEDDDYGPMLVNSTLTGNVKDNDTDEDHDGTVQLLTNVAHGMLTLLPSGEFTYKPTTNYIGSDTFTYRLFDGEGPGDTATVTIEVTNVYLDGSTLIASGLNGADRIVVQSAGGGIGIRFNNALVSGFPGVTKVVVYGGEGADTMTVSNVNVPVEFYGQGGNDYLAGGSANDLLDGGEGADRLLGGGGHDVLLGGGGADTLSGGVGADYASGDDSVDNIHGVMLTLDQLDDPIFVSASTKPGKDTINGDAGDDVLLGGGDADKVYGGAGFDLVRGGLGNDTLDGGADDDLLYGEVGADLMYGRQGNDVLIGGDGNDTIYGSTGADLILSGKIDASLDDDLALLALLDDWSNGGDYQATADYLEGFAEDDTVSDSLYGEGDADWFLYYFAKGDRIKVAADNKLPNVVKNLS